MRSREFIREAGGRVGLGRIIIQKIDDAIQGIVYILRKPNGDTVRDQAGQTLSFPTKDAAAAARNKMADPSAVQGASDAEKTIARKQLADKAEAGKLGSGSFKIPVRDPSTGKLTQKVTITDADGKEKVVVKSFDDWGDFANKTGLWPAESWRPGYLMQITKLLTSRMPIIGLFFTTGDVALIGNILLDWRKALDAIKESYKRNDYYIIQGNGRQQAELEMQAVNKEFIIKLTKAVGTIMAANSAGLIVGKLSKGNAGAEVADGLVKLFKLAGKRVNPSIIKTLNAGGVEAAKLFSAAWISDAEFKANIENALVRGILEGTEWYADAAASVVQLPVFGDLDLSIGTISPSDDAAMRKSAALNKEPETPAPPAGTPPKGPIDRAIDKFKAL